MFTFTFPDGDTWNATVYPSLNGNVVLENFRVVSINDGTLRMSPGSFVPTNRVSVGTPVFTKDKVHGIVRMTNETHSLISMEDGTCDMHENASLSYSMMTTIDKELPPHTERDGYLIPVMGAPAGAPAEAPAEAPADKSSQAGSNDEVCEECDTYDVVRIKRPTRASICAKPCTIMIGCTLGLHHSGICNSATYEKRNRKRTEFFARAPEPESDSDDDIPLTRRTKRATNESRGMLTEHEDQFSREFRIAVQGIVDQWCIGAYEDGEPMYKHVARRQNGYYVQTRVNGNTRYVGTFARNLVGVYAAIAMTLFPDTLIDNGHIRNWVNMMITDEVISTCCANEILNSVLNFEPLVEELD